MKKSIVYLGVALIALANVSFATNSNSLTVNKSIVSTYDDATPLGTAICKGDIDAVKKFIVYGADVNEKSNGMTPLMIAARYNKIEIIKLLLSNGANLDAKDEKGFTATALNALEFVSKNDALLTLGIKPTRPDTGYGYIQYDIEDQIDTVFRVRTFSEKPSLELARTFLKSGDFLWNAGIFIWNVNTIKAALEKYLPELNDVFVQAKEAYNTPKESELINQLYAQCTNISIDYGIMEKAKNVFVVPSYFGWCDLGTWESAYDNFEKDYLGNAVHGDNVMIIDATECMIKAPKQKLVVLQGLEKFIVVDTEDVLLICERNREQQIKEYVAEVKRNKGDKFL